MPVSSLTKQAVKVSWEAAGRDSHELTGAFTPRLAGTCHLAITYAGAHIQGAAAAPESLGHRTALESLGHGTTLTRFAARQLPAW